MDSTTRVGRTVGDTGFRVSDRPSFSDQVEQIMSKTISDASKMGFASSGMKKQFMNTVSGLSKHNSYYGNYEIPNDLDSITGIPIR